MNAKHRIWTLLALASVLLLAACAGSNPADNAKAFYQAAAAGDADTATSLVSFSNTTGSKADMAKAKVGIITAAIKAKIDMHGGLDSIESDKVSKTDDTHATVHVILHFKDGSQKGHSVKMVREDGKWLLQLGG